MFNFETWEKHSDVAIGQQSDKKKAHKAWLYTGYDDMNAS